MERDDPVDLWQPDDTVAMKKPSWTDRAHESNPGDKADISPADDGTGDSCARQSAAGRDDSTTWLS